jgi:thioredoxin 1
LEIEMSENVREFTTGNWDQEVLGSDEPVLVDFWAEWCPPCRAIAPTIESVAGEFAGRVKVGKLDVDNNNEVAGKYGIRSIPTLLVFSKGQVVEQRVGALGKEDLVKLLDGQLASAKTA